MVWVLAEVSPIHAMYPEVIAIPSQAPYLMPGDFCKVWLVPEETEVARHPIKYGEKFWVQVKERLEDGYIGELCQPLVLAQIKAGALIRFKHQHILEVQEE